MRLEFPCTNNQAEYKALLIGLEQLVDMRVRDVQVFGDSELVVMQVQGKRQCFDGILNEYRDKCVDMIKSFNTFCITHIGRGRMEERIC